MEIILKTINNGIHSLIQIDVQNAESEYLPVLAKLLSVTEAYNKDNIDKA